MMKKRTLLIGLLFGASSACSASESAYRKPPTEAQVTQLISTYVKAWSEGNVEKMYASFYENKTSFSDFQKTHAQVIVTDKRPVRLASIGKPCLARTPMLWVVDYALEFILPNGSPLVRYYQGFIDECDDDYGLRATVPYFSQRELEFMKIAVNEFMSNWRNEYSQAFNLGFFDTNKTQTVIHEQFMKLTKQLKNKPDLKRIEGWALEPIEYVSNNHAHVYAELLGLDITLQITLIRQGITWRIANVSLSAPMRTRDSAWRCVHAYLSAWVVGDAEKMFAQFHALQGDARHVFGYKTQEIHRPILIQSIDAPVFTGTQTATVGYECLFYGSSQKEEIAKSRLATVRNFDGRWCLDADWEKVSFADEQQCKQLLDHYVQSWIAGDSAAMQHCFVTNSVSVSALQDKIRREIKEQKKPEKFMSFNGMSVDRHGALEIYFTVESQSGNQDYTARFVRDDNPDWKISSVMLRVPREIAAGLQRKVSEYVTAWIKGDTSKMFSCMDDLNMTEAEFPQVIQAKLTKDAKPERLGYIDIPYFVGGGEIRLPYTVVVMQREQECVAIFTFDEKKQIWKFVGNRQNSDTRKEP